MEKKGGDRGHGKVNQNPCVSVAEWHREGPISDLLATTTKYSSSHPLKA